MKYYDDDDSKMHPSYRANEQDFGCEFCWDMRAKRNIELYFFDRANNMRICTYCPSCGRKY